MPDVRDPLESKMPKTASREVLDFLYKCLDRDPAKRWTCDQLMKHQYFNGFSFRVPTSDQEEYENRRSTATLYSMNGNNNGSTTLPHLSNGSPSDKANTNQQQTYQSKNYVQTRDTNSFDKLPTI